MTEEESLEARVTALEAAVAALQERLDGAVNRDIPLLKGTIRASLNADIDDIGELPDAGRAFNRRVETHADRLEALEQYVAALGDVGTTQTSKEQKLAAICHFAQNKRGQRSTVAVTAEDIQGCVGVSRRYAYDLIDEAAAVLAGVRVREATDVRTSTGLEHKKKALLVDCEQVHASEGGMNKFTTGQGGENGRPMTAITQEGEQ